MKCKLCDGKGTDNYHKTEECQNCEGTGNAPNDVTSPKKSYKTKKID